MLEVQLMKLPFTKRNQNFKKYCLWFSPNHSKPKNNIFKLFITFDKIIFFLQFFTRHFLAKSLKIAFIKNCLRTFNSELTITILLEVFFSQRFYPLKRNLNKRNFHYDENNVCNVELIFYRKYCELTFIQFLYTKEHAFRHNIAIQKQKS